MARESHLSIRVSPEQKEALERRARELDLSVGQLVRRALQDLPGPVGEKPARTSMPEPPISPVAVGHGAVRRSRESELRWLWEHRDELGRYAGEWLILEGNELVAHGRDYLKVLAQARAKGVTVPFVERIPDEGSADAWIGL